MATRLDSLDPDHPDPDLLDEAAAILRAGGLVAFATETVYGLGADATNPEAVARIFQAKGRPATNPLIVHVAGIDDARRCVSEWPDAAEILARAFWPGPLTLVLPRSAIIPDLVTAGLDTVGVRMPRTPVALELIRRSGRPLAAPSANRSTGVSPTRAEHVRKDLDGRVAWILDSGPTALGLESTVLDLSGPPPYRILRPGPVTWHDLNERFGLLVEPPATALHTPVDQPASSPGQLAIHYAPRTRAVRVERTSDLAAIPWTDRSALLLVGPVPKDLPALPPLVLRFELPTPELAARELYATLHHCDTLGLDLIAILLPPDLPHWHAVRDRLQRATVPA